MKRLLSTEGFVGTMIVLLIALFLIAPAFAGGGHNDPRCDDGSCNEVEVDVDARADAEAYAEAESDASAEAIATNEGNTVEINDVRPDDIKIRNVPSMSAPSVYPTTSCFKGASGSLSVAGGGLSLGGGKIDDSCVERELIRIAAEMGLTSRAVYMWCSQPHAIQRFGSQENCLGFDDDELQRIIEEVQRKLEICKETSRRKEKAFMECLRK